MELSVINKKVLLTGHTGFKGSWLTILLSHLEAHVLGFSLPAEKKSLFKNISFSARTVTCRIEELSTLQECAAQFEFYSLVFEENTDAKNTMHLFCIINKEFHITEELVSLVALNGKTTTTDVQRAVDFGDQDDD